MSEENKENTVEDEVTSTDASENTEEEVVDQGNKIPYSRFKQKVDEANALKERLAEIEKKQEDAERKKLEEKEEYETLYVSALEQLEAYKASAKDSRKESLLSQAGYGEEQISVLKGAVNGDTDEEITESIERLLTAFPIKKTYVDPGVGNSAKEGVETVDGEDIGRSMFSKLVESGRIKGVRK